MALERLILMRHGKAEERSPSGKDFDRPLAPRGHSEARAMGRRLAEAGFRPDLALVSSAVRASQTWDEAALALMGVETRRSPALYHASPTVMIEAAQAAGGRCVILVGHNPGLHALAFELYAQSSKNPAGRELARGFPTAAAAVFGFEDGRAVCEAFLAPKGEDA